jgi:hypothetical protein
MPIPNVVVPSAPIDFSTLPATVPLSSAGSTVSGAAAYNWFLIEKPDGSTAEISDPNDANPDLINVDVRGTYIVFLSITDTTGSSHPAPYPTQATTPPYRFKNPLASAFGVIRVAEENGLVKPGRGQFGWLESVWSLIDKVVDLRDVVETERVEAPAGADLAISSSSGDVEVTAGNQISLIGTAGGVEIATSNGIISLTSIAGSVEISTPSGTADINALVVYKVADDVQISCDTGSILVASPMNVTSADGITASAGSVATSELRSLAGSNLGLVADNNLSVQSAGSFTVEAGDGISLTATTGSVDISVGGREVSFAQDASGLSSGAPAIVSSDLEGVFVQATHYPGSMLYVAEQVELSASDNVAVTAFGSNGAASLVGRAAATVTALSENATASINANGVGGKIELNPNVHTVTTKPIRAPGLAGTATAFYDPRIPLPANGSALLFSGNPASPRYANATRFTRHGPGSEVRMELSLVGTFNTTDDHIDLEIVAREASGINSFVLQVMPNNQLKLGVDAVIRLTPLSATRLMRVVTLNTFNPDTNHPNAGLGDVVICDVVTYSQASSMAVMTYDITLYDGGAGVGSYSATLVSSLTNPHTQDVL